MLSSQRILKFFFLLILYFIFCPNSYALFFDRRVTSPPTLSYFFIPVAGNIPGIQSFVGISGGISGIKESNVDIALFSVLGEANENFDEHGDGGNFSLNIATITDIPASRIFTNNNNLLTLSFYYGDGKNVAFPQRARGIDSPKDDFSFILLNSFNFQGLQLSLQFYQQQLEFYYTFASGGANPLGFVPNGGGKFRKNENANVTSRGDGSRLGIYIDDTDNRRDPRVGYRVQYETYNLPSTRGESPAFFQDDYNITGFFPLTAKNDLVLVANQFYASSTVTQTGTVNPSNYECNGKTGCNQTDEDEREQQARKEAKLGNATSLGGVLRLRGYPTGRFYDSYTNFQGLELRWYLFEKERSFDFVVEKGVQTSWQFAFFYEQGTVARTPDDLWANFKNSYGTGVRVLFTSLVIRADFGFSEEDRATSVFFGYPF